MSELDRLDRLIAAEQDERRRIALFLHDGPVQNLSGIALMLDVQACAREVGLPVTLDVVKSNPARRLFERLGFTVMADGVLHVTLSWTQVAP